MCAVWVDIKWEVFFLLIFSICLFEYDAWLRWCVKWFSIIPIFHQRSLLTRATSKWHKIHQTNWINTNRKIEEIWKTKTKVHLSSHLIYTFITLINELFIGANQLSFKHISSFLFVHVFGIWPFISLFEQREEKKTLIKCTTTLIKWNEWNENINAKENWMT